MKPSRGAGRPSCVAVQPNNVELSRRRRIELVAAFKALDEDAQADLLEAVESIVGRPRASVDIERDDAAAVIGQVYAIAGWPS